MTQFKKIIGFIGFILIYFIFLSKIKDLDYWVKIAISVIFSIIIGFILAIISEKLKS